MIFDSLCDLCVRCGEPLLLIANCYLLLLRSVNICVDLRLKLKWYWIGRIGVIVKSLAGLPAVPTGHHQPLQQWR